MKATKNGLKECYPMGFGSSMALYGPTVSKACHALLPLSSDKTFLMVIQATCSFTPSMRTVGPAQFKVQKSSGRNKACQLCLIFGFASAVWMPKEMVLILDASWKPHHSSSADILAVGGSALTING